MNLPTEVAEAWPCYRLVLERYATWAEIRKMTIDDVDLLNLSIDEWQRAERAARKGA